MTKGLKQIAKRRRKAFERAQAKVAFSDKTKTVLTAISAGRNP